MCWSHWGLHGNIFAQGSWINAQYMWYFIQLWSWSELCDWVLEWLGLTEKLSGGVALVPGWTYTINSTTSHSHQVCLNTKTPQLANSVLKSVYLQVLYNNPKITVQDNWTCCERTKSTYFRRYLQIYNSTVLRMWFCWLCVGWSQPSVDYRRISWHLSYQRNHLHAWTASLPSLSLQISFITGIRNQSISAHTNIHTNINSIKVKIVPKF